MKKNAVIFDKNLKALKENNPEAAAAVLRARGEPAGFEFAVSKSGAPTAKFTDADGRTAFIHSSYDPEAEAKKFAFTFSPSHGKWIAFLGPGLWYGVRELKNRMYHSPILVIETDPELLRAVIERVPIDDMLSAPGIRVVTGTVDEIKASLKAKPVRVDTEKNRIFFPKIAAIYEEAYRELMDFISCMAVEVQYAIDPENVVRREAFGPIDPKKMKILATNYDRYSDAIADVFSPHGVEMKSIFDFEGVEAAFSYDATFLFSFTANLMTCPDILELIKEIKNRRDIPVVLWNTEDPVNFADDKTRRVIIAAARIADVFVTQTAQFLHLYEREGVTAHYLPTAARPEMFGDPARDDEMELDFMFFGFWTPKREAFFDRLTKKLPDMKYELIGPGLAPEDFRYKLRRARVNLTALTSCDLMGDDHWALSDRVWEIPYAGGFLLQDHRKHIEDHFDPSEVATFRDADDCAEKIRYYVSRPEERARILDAARRRIRLEHLWAHRMEKILELVIRARY